MKMISIAMCTYNGERFIIEQLDSILNQTYENIELVIVDDGSKDDTIAIIKQYIEKDNRIKLFENSINLGYVKNFEKAISLCGGEFISLADQDDVWKNDKLEKLLDTLEKSDSQLIYSDALLVDDHLKSQEKTLIESLNLKPIIDDNSLFFLFQNTVSGNTLMFKKELVEDILPFPDEISFHDIWIAFIASTIAPIIYIKEPLVYYRRHEENVTNLHKKKVKKTYQIKINKKIESFEKRLKNIELLLSYMENNDPNHRDYKTIYKIYDELKKYKHYYINFSLFQVLRENKSQLFYSKKPMTFLHIFKMALGIRLYKIFPFI